MPRKSKDVKRKGKDKAREHFAKCGKYDGKSVRRIEAYLEKVNPGNKVNLNPV
jgi:ribosomal protein L22